MTGRRKTYHLAGKIVREGGNLKIVQVSEEDVDGIDSMPSWRRGLWHGGWYIPNRNDEIGSPVRGPDAIATFGGEDYLARRLADDNLIIANDCEQMGFCLDKPDDGTTYIALYPTMK